MSLFAMALLLSIPCSLLSYALVRSLRPWHHDPLRVRCYVRGAGVTIIEPGDDRRIVGEAPVARSALLRHLHQNGA